MSLWATIEVREETEATNLNRLKEEGKHFIYVQVRSVCTLEGTPQETFMQSVTVLESRLKYICYFSPQDRKTQEER